MNMRNKFRKKNMLQPLVLQKAMKFLNNSDQRNKIKRKLLRNIYKIKQILRETIKEIKDQKKIEDNFSKAFKEMKLKYKKDSLKL